MKWFVGALAAALLLLQYRIWFSTDGVSEVWRLRTAVAAQQSDNERLSARNRQLAAEVRDLKQGYSALGASPFRSGHGRDQRDLFQVGPAEAPVIALGPGCDCAAVPTAAAGAGSGTPRRGPLPCADRGGPNCQCQPPCATGWLCPQPGQPPLRRQGRQTARRAGWSHRARMLAAVVCRGRTLRGVALALAPAASADKALRARLAPRS